MDCFFAETDNYKVPQRAAHTVSLMFDRNQQIVLPYMNRLIISVLNPELTSSLKRNILRILQSMEIPENFLGEIYEACYGFLINPKEEIAIRAFAITVLYNISEKYPELKPELAATIESVLSEPGCSPGVQSRAKKALKNLYSNSL